MQDKFGNWLKSTCSRCEAELLGLGLKISEIGTHSFRKGVATFLNGVPGTSPISIYLRAGWSLGRVVSRYILDGQGGDHLCGRAATGLPIVSKDFAMLPPHFNITRDGAPLTPEEWAVYLPGYTDFFPQAFRQVVPYLLASLVYHREFLENTLHVDHPLRKARVWTSGILPTLDSKVFGGKRTDAGSSVMSATGIPPHIVIAQELDELKQVFLRFIDKVDGNFEALPQTLKEMLLANFAINGAVPVTREEIVSMFRDMQQNLREEMTSIRREIRQSAATGAALETQALIDVDGGEDLNPIARLAPVNMTPFHTWGGSLHAVPQNFQFPT